MLSFSIIFCALRGSVSGTAKPIPNRVPKMVVESDPNRLPSGWIGIETQDARDVLEELIKESAAFGILCNLQTLVHFLDNSFELNRIVSVDRLLQLIDLVQVFYTSELTLFHV